MGDRYGPMVVAKQPYTTDQMKQMIIAVPGEKTTALLALRLFHPQIKYEIVPFDQIIPSVLRGEYQAGLIIHEGQLTYKQEGLHKIIDMGEWWYEQTALPLPLGGNVIRRDLGRELMLKISDYIRRSIAYSLEHREDALKYALQFAGDMEPGLADQFVGMYVNHWTLDYEKRGKKAVQLLLDKGYESGIIDKKIVVDYLE